MKKILFFCLISAFARSQNNDSSRASCSYTPSIIYEMPENCAFSGNSVSGPITITVVGLPAGDWTLYDQNAGYLYSGTGTPATFSVDANQLHNVQLYFIDSTGCQSPTSFAYDLPYEKHVFNEVPEMNCEYRDINANGIRDLGDQIYYYIYIKNAGACPFNTPTINYGYNPNLMFSGEGSFDTYWQLPSLQGNYTYGVLAKYNVTEQDLMTGTVTNETIVNVSWPGTSAAFFPSCTTTWTVLGTDESSKAKFSCYPNPAHDRIMLTGTHIIDRLTIADMAGRPVLATTVGLKESCVDLSQLSSGSYFITLFSGDDTKVVRILKQ